ncbi:hypothetical protein V5T82_00870 [Magnetovibrio sp. PR-2]|uniref:hypothetical protein n=1 Tax=Magnetovibrio sp. PR-2 TaxID=3120356 RepID=UPI002FCE1491
MKNQNNTENIWGLGFIACVVVGVPWWLSGFNTDVFLYWFRVVATLGLAGLIVLPMMRFIERKLNRTIAVLLSIALLPEIVLSLHFIFMPWIFD